MKSIRAEWRSAQGASVMVQPHLCGDAECGSIVLSIADGVLNTVPEGKHAHAGKTVVCAQLAPDEAQMLCTALMTLLTVRHLECCIRAGLGAEPDPAYVGPATRDILAIANEFLANEESCA